MKYAVLLCDGMADTPREDLGGTTPMGKANKPNMRIGISHLNAYTLGALFQFFMISTAFTAEFLNINAFDQPGVEESKVANFALMGKDGYEQKAAEISAFLAENPRSVFEF